MASIVVRGKSFAVVYMTDIHGQRKQKWETYHSREEAERRKQTLEMYQQTAHRKERDQVETVSDLMKLYVALYGHTKWSLSTFQSNCGLLRNYILPLFGSIRLKELSPLMVAELYRDLLRQPRYHGPYHKHPGQTVTVSVLRDIHKLLHSAFEQAVLWEYVPRNPFHRAVLPHMPDRPRDLLCPEQISRLLERCDDPQLTLAIHLAFAGTLRKGELLALTWEDVDWKNSAIQVNKTLRRVSREALEALSFQGVLFEFPPILREEKTALVLKSPKTASSNRIVFLPDTVMLRLKEHRDRQGEKNMPKGHPDLIFRYGDGRPLQETTLTKHFQSALRKARLPQVTFHSLRHSSITYKLILSAGDIKAVQGDSGHAQAEMITEIYSHIIDKNRRANALRFEMEFYKNL